MAQDVVVTTTATKDTIKVEWTPELATATFGRNGKDSTGFGSWTSIVGVTSPQTLRSLLPDTSYDVTVIGKIDGEKVSTTVTVKTLAAGEAPVPPQVPTPTLTVKPTPTTNSIKVEYAPAMKDAVISRDGRDSNGYGVWSSDPGAPSGLELKNLFGRTNYGITVQGTIDGKPVKVYVKVSTLQAVKPPAPTPPPPVPTPTPTPTPTPVPPPPPTLSKATFLAMTFGAAVSDAASGGFNTWAGRRHGAYATWGDNGKVWAIDTPNSEYGSNSVARLGDYDLDIAPQRKLRNGWEGAARGDDDAVWRADLTELKTKWGSRKGHVFYRTWHEFNGNWYAWSTRTAGDQENMKKASVRLRKIFDEVFAGDKRFHLEVSPNRDSKYSLDVRNAIAKDVWHVLGLDYYDFGIKQGGDWNQEKVRRAKNGSPEGILPWFEFCEQLQIPMSLPEFGVQFGDNTTFLNGVLPIMAERRYDGTGSAAGKLLFYCWHNLRNKANAIEEGSGGDFFITSGGKDYSKRSGSSKVMREWIQKSTWLRTA